MLRKKIIVHLHGGGYRLFYEQQSPFRQRIIRWTLRRTARIIVLGELLRNQFDFWDAPELIVVVPNGMAHPTGSQSMVAKQAPTKDEPWRCLYLSNLMETKGYYVLLEAAELLCANQAYNFQSISVVVLLNPAQNLVVLQEQLNCKLILIARLMKIRSTSLLPTTVLWEVPRKKSC